MKNKSRLNCICDSYLNLNKELVLNPIFNDISYEEIILYTLLDDKMRSCYGNPDFGDENGTFILFKQKEISGLLHVPERTLRDWFRKLEEHYLIKTQKRGLGLPQKIYLRDIDDLIQERQQKCEGGNP